MQTQNLRLLVDGVPYEVTAVPFTFNDEIRFRVSYNGSEDYIFARDVSVGQLTAIGVEALDIPDNLEEAISEKLSGVVI